MSDGMGREFTYLSSHATNRYFIPNWGNVLHFIYYVHLPQPVGKDKYTFVHLLKESPYPALDALPINPILFNAHILSYLFCY